MIKSEGEKIKFFIKKFIVYFYIRNTLYVCMCVWVCVYIYICVFLYNYVEIYNQASSYIHTYTLATISKVDI